MNASAVSHCSLPGAMAVSFHANALVCYDSRFITLPWGSSGRTSPLRCNLIRVRSASADNREQASFLDAAVHSAALRARESLQEEPLFHDPYAACLAAVKIGTRVSQPVQVDGELGDYALATKYIDDKLLEVVKDVNSQVRQIVLLTDGMDTRPYRLPWPPSSFIFDVSPSRAYSIADENLKAIGAKIPRRCMFRHISAELVEGEDWKDKGWGEKLVKLGYRGDRPSVWAMQGVHKMTADGLQVVLGQASSMAMNNTTFVGELPISALSDISQEEARQGLLRVFLACGFDTEIIEYEKIAAGLGLQKRHVVDGRSQSIESSLLFVAKQLRLSDDQVAYVRNRIEQAEEDGDEEGFEEW